jgi:hypothetical protein
MLARAIPPTNPEKSMTRPLRTVSFGGAVLAAAAIGIGCSSSTSVNNSGPPTLDGAITQMAQAVCTRLQQCAPSSFSTNYPGGLSDCESQAKSSADMAATSKGRDVNATAQCSNAQLQTCISDINAASCDVVNSPTTTLPDSCNMKC